MVQEILEVVRQLCELLGDDAGDARDVGVVVPAQGVELPQAAVERLRLHGVLLAHIEGVRNDLVLICKHGVAVQHKGTRRVGAQHVV